MAMCKESFIDVLYICYLQDKYTILSQKWLAAAEEIVHVFMPNTLYHLTDPSAVLITRMHYIF